MKIDSVDYHTQSVPFDISLILLCVVTQKDSILINLYKDRANLKDCCLKSDYLRDRLDRADDLYFSPLCVRPWKRLQGLHFSLSFISLIGGYCCLNSTEIEGFIKFEGCILQIYISRRSDLLLVQHLDRLLQHSFNLAQLFLRLNLFLVLSDNQRLCKFGLVG